MGRSPERGDRVLLSPHILNNDVVHIVVFDLGGQININLDPVLRILFFNGVQERVEPFGSPKVADDPGKVDFGEASRLGIIKVVHSVPNRLEDGSKRSDADTSTDQEYRLILQEILTSASERTIDHDSGQNPVNGRDDESSLLLSLVLGIEITSAGLGESGSKVSDNPDVYAQVIFLGSGGEGKRMPLEVRDLGARKEDVLTGSDGGLFLLDLEFHDLGRVLDDL